MALTIISLDKLKEHEEIEHEYLEKLKNQIQKDGVLKRPIVVDRNSKIILDGHFRYNTLKKLGYTKIPAYFVDYTSPDIIVGSWKEKKVVTKEDVIKAGLTGKKLPPKTSKHMLDLSNHQIHISKIVKKIKIPLEDLK
ncbi:MAG: ParB N-terminal domain-containing protein [Candidatus Heimdallarchaeaceae archaeon]